MTRAENESAFEWVPLEGFGITVGSGDRLMVIRDAVLDLMTVLDGCHVQGLSRDTIDSLARHCSIFLRKMVLGDRRNQPLLDFKTCEDMGLVFHRIKAVRGERQIRTVLHQTVYGNRMRATLTDTEAGETLGHELHQTDDPSELKIETEWPLPGIVDWIEYPTSSEPWKISPSGLVDLDVEMGHDCKRWLAQQLVLFDDRPISLRHVVRAVVNVEGAHAPLMVELMRPKDERNRRQPDTIKNPGSYALLCVVTGDVPYAHIITIEAGLYICFSLLMKGILGSLTRGIAAPELIVFGSEFDEPDAQFPLRFEGGVRVPFGPNAGGRKELHFVRAPRAR